MIKVRLIFVLCVIFVAFFIIDSHADVIHLKNKRDMQGIVKSESSEEIVLDVGCGTVSIKKSDIEHIEKGDQGENKKILKTWQNQYAETGRWVASGGEAMLSALQEAKSRRLDVIRAKQERQNLQDNIESCEKELVAVYEKSANLSSQLKQMGKASDPFVYNNLVAEVNSASAEIARRTQVARKNEDLKRDLDSKLSKCVQDYATALSSLTESFNNKYAMLKKQGIREEDENFYKWVEGEINKMHSEFERRDIAFSKQKSGIVVEAMLNDKLKVPLIVDTGASLVVISRNIARQLGVNESEKGRVIELLLADGKKINASPVILSSIDVGGSRVRNVMAAVIDTPPALDADGLLGMSFLSNFFVRIDSSSNSLTLEKFNPQ